MFQMYNESMNETGKPITIAICDDSTRVIEQIQEYLHTYMQTIHTPIQVRTFTDGHSLSAAFSKGNDFDICFLDILMPGFSGMETAKEIRHFNTHTRIIFLTSSPEYALESYAVKAYDYILKPVSTERLNALMNDVLKEIEHRDGSGIVVKSDSGVQMLLLSNIIYVEAMGKKTVYHLYPEGIVTCKEKFAEVCSRLSTEGMFLQTHRSYLLNLNYVDRIIGNDIILSNQETVPIAQGRTKEIRQAYLSYQMEDKT